MTTPLIVGGLATLLLGLALTPILRHVARARGLVAAPRHDRWHRRPTALLGGVAIYLAFLAGYLLFVPPFSGRQLILAAGTLMFLVGLADDFLRLKPYIKLVVQVVAAALVVYFGQRLPWTDYGVVNIFVTIFWLVGITNAINLLDNMDGLAAGIVAIACVFLAATFLLNGQTAQAMVPTVLAGATLAFLVFNFKPATIFMGDCGSLLLGFVLGATALLSDYERTRHLGAVLLTPVLILLIPIFDTCFVTVTRKLAGRPVTLGGRDHTSHRLVALGVTERRAVLLLYALAAGGGALALLLRGLGWEMLLWLAPSLALVMLALGVYLGKVHVYEAGQQPAGNTILNTLADFTYKRRVLEILLDVMLVTLAYYGAYLLRFDGGITAEQVQTLFRTLPLVIAAQMLFLLGGGVYRGLWRYLDMEELLAIVKSVVAGTLMSAALVWALNGGWLAAGTVFVLYALLLFLFIVASRFSFRLLRALLIGRAPVAVDAKPVLIYGAGDRGEFLLRELLDNPDYSRRPVGFIDDDPRTLGKLIHGYRTFGNGELPGLIARLGEIEVLIACAQVSESRLAYLRGLGVGVLRMTILIESESTAEATPTARRQPLSLPVNGVARAGQGISL